MSFPCQLCKEPRGTSSHGGLFRHGRFLKRDEANLGVQGEKGGSWVSNPFAVTFHARGGGQCTAPV